MRNLALKKIGRRERVVAANAPVFRVLRIANGLVFNVELGTLVRKSKLVGWWGNPSGWGYSQTCLLDYYATEEVS